jgi:carbonic anhydrase
MPKTEEYLALDGAIHQTFQENLTPFEAFQLLQNGHERFLNHLTHRRSRGNLLADAAAGQFPYAAVLGCIDSRVPVEEVFDAAFGDMFVARVAGNTVSPEILGSLEYACKYAGAKLILVLGHTKCGAVQGAWSKLVDGNITELLSHIEPAVNEVQAAKGTEPTDENLNACVTANVMHTVQQIREKSPTLADLEAGGKIALVGGRYDISTGQVEFVVQPSWAGETKLPA